MTGPIDTLRTVADTLGQAHVHPVKVQVTAHHNGPIVDILTATRTRGEEPCPDCRAAHAAKQRDWSRRAREAS